MRRGLAIALAAVMLAGCGGLDDRDREALEAFQNDPLFEIVPPGATKARDFLTPGSPDRSESRPGSANNRHVSWDDVDGTPEQVIQTYVVALQELGWHEIVLTCADELGAGYGIRAARARDQRVDVVRVGASYDSSRDGEVGVYIAMDAPHHGSPQYAEPDPDVPPDTTCLDAQAASS